MFYWMKPLPDADIDYEKYKPFIKNDWFRRNFMYFVYVLQATLVILSIVLGVWNFSNFFIRLILFMLVYVVHELLHISVVWRIGDISLTHSGIFFWLNSSAKMSKLRFLLYLNGSGRVIAVLLILPQAVCAAAIYKMFVSQKDNKMYPKIIYITSIIEIISSVYIECAICKFFAYVDPMSILTECLLGISLIVLIIYQTRVLSQKRQLGLDIKRCSSIN